MQRKYIYILVSILTVILVSINNVVELNSQNKTNSKNQGNLIVEEQEPSYKGVEISSPLIVKNYQNDENKTTYSYRIKIENAVGAYRYEYNEKESYLVFNAIGESQFTLRSNELITIYDLPKNAEYEIEQVTDVSEKYVTKINNETKKIATGILTLENNIEFYNETIKVETEPVKKNPVTSDVYTLGIVCFLITTIIFIALKKIKIKRFDY